MNRLLLPWLVSLVLTSAAAQSIVTYTNANELVSMGTYGTYFVDSTNSLSYSDIQKIPAHRFKAIKGRLNLGFEHARVWLKFDLRNATTEKLYAILLAQDVDYVDAYLRGKDRNYLVQTGAMRPYHKRTFDINSIVLDLGTQPTQLMLGIRDMNGLNFQIKVGAIKPLTEEIYFETLINAFTMGVLALTVIFSLFIYFTFKDLVYLLYSIHVVFLGLVFMAFEGYLSDFFWREMPFMNNGINSSIIRLGSLLTGIWFSVAFLTVKNILPRVHTVFVGLGWYAGFIFLLKLLGFQWAEMAFNLAIILTFATFLTTGIWMYRLGFKSARFYLLGWGVFIVEVLLVELALFGFLSFNHFYTYYGFHIGAVFQVLFLNVALVDRIKTLQREHNEAKELALERIAENERLMIAQSQLLEQKMEQPKDNSADIELLIREIREQREKVKKIAIATMEGVLLFPVVDIVRIEAMGSYANVYFPNNQKMLASRSLAEFESQLGQDSSFFRVHKSHIVNLNYVTKYIRGIGGYVVMQDGSSVEVSRRNKADFLKVMNLES